MNMLGDGLNTPKAKSGLPPFSKEIEKALFDSEILRNHLTIEIKTPESWIQEYRVVYRNKKKRGETEKDNILNCIRLPPRRKKVHRNLSVHDRKGHRLTVVPTKLVNEALVNICEFYISEALVSATNTQREYFEEIIQNTVNFRDVFSYDSKPEIIQGILDKLGRIITRLESQTESSRSLFYLRNIYFLASVYKNFYIPIIKLEEPLNPRDCILISYSVENLTKPSMSNRTLYLRGSLNLSFPLEPETGASNHIRILSPPGMMFRRAGISGLEDTQDLQGAYADLNELLDDDMVYFHIPEKKTNEIRKLQEKKMINGEDEIKIKVGLGIDKDFPKRLSLIRNLVFLMYITAIMPLLAFLFPYKDFVFGFSVVSLSILITLAILVSLAVYSMEKRFLHDYVAGQLFILTAIYSAELLIIIPFW